jgi:hypothetical protein
MLVVIKWIQRKGRGVWNEAKVVGDVPGSAHVPRPLNG